MSLPLRSASHVARATFAIALVLAGPARADYPWPADGAPVCNAPGDQHRLFYSSAACNRFVFEWLHSIGGADTLRAAGVSTVPPTGDCSGAPFFETSPDASGVTELSAMEVFYPVIAVDQPLLPVCTGPPPSAQVWLQGSGATSQLVLHDGIWLYNGHERAIVDDGDFVRHHPRLGSTGGAVLDTAFVVVWSDERTGVAQIRAQRVTQSGTREWGPSGTLIAPTGTPQSDPEIARVQNGNTLVVWLDERSGGTDVYALCLLPDGSIAPGWPAGGLALEDRPEISGSPLLVGAAEFAPPAFVVWEESGPRFVGGRSIVARRLLPDGTPDPAWSALGVPLSSSATVEHLQDARNAGSTFSPELVAVWADTRAATGSNPTDLYAQWLTPSGAPASGWPASGLAICTAPGRQDAARVSVTDTYAAFAWEDHRAADADVYAELRMGDGTLPYGLWVPNGLPATSAPGDQTAPVVGVGNGGGCYVAWEDARDVATSGLDIYAQAFTNQGDKLDASSGPIPRALALDAPWPNPTRSSSRFTVQVPRGGHARLEVLDVLGRRVRTIDAGDLSAGSHEILFDGRDDAGRELPPGLYRVHARTGSESSSRALVRVH